VFNNLVEEKWEIEAERSLSGITASQHHSGRETQELTERTRLSVDGLISSFCNSIECDDPIKR
jgi:hypothetical protein